MDKNDDFAALVANLKKKTKEIEKIIKNYNIPIEAKKKLIFQLAEIQDILTRVDKTVESSFINNESKDYKIKTASVTSTTSDTKNIRIEVLDNNDKKLNAFYLEKEFKPDKITIESSENCKKVKLEITSVENFTKSKTIHLSGDTKEDEIKFKNTDDNKEIRKEQSN